PVMALIETPAQADGRMHCIHGFQCDPERADGALEHGTIGQVEFEAFLLEQLACLARLLAPGFGQIDVGPAGETVFEVPLALAVAHQDKFVHGKSHMEVNNCRPFYNRLILPFIPAYFRNKPWTFSQTRPTSF